MSPKSILQFLAVCGSAKVVEAFATAPERFGGSVKVEVKQESSQIGGSTRCPCYSKSECKFRGVGLILAPDDTDIVNKTNACWEDCYKDPINGNGSSATDWAKCQGGAEQWRADACSPTYALDRAIGSIFNKIGGKICETNAGASISLCTELQAIQSPYKILQGKGCQDTFEESAPDGNAKKRFCESLHYVVDNGFQDAYRCAHSKNGNGKHLCRPSKDIQNNIVMTPICYNVSFQQVHGYGSPAPNTYGCVAPRDCVLGEKSIRQPIYRRVATAIFG